MGKGKRLKKTFKEMKKQGFTKYYDTFSPFVIAPLLPQRKQE